MKAVLQAPEFPRNLKHCYHRKDSWCPDCMAAVLDAINLIVKTHYRQIKPTEKKSRPSSS